MRAHTRRRARTARRHLYRYRVSFAVLAALLLAGCGSATSVLNPRGPAAAQIANLWWVLFGLATAVFLAVLTIGLLALFRRRDAQQQPANWRRFVIGGGVIMPAIVLSVVFGMTIWTMRALAARETALTVKVTGWQWWWEIYYPESGFYTANEIHIPTGQPVLLELTSGDVIHNFWVPQLHGKFDLIPGNVNSFWIQADEPGTYRGICAEYCGTQHAKMNFVVVAEPPDVYAAWVARQQQPAPQPTDPVLLRGQQVFASAACIYCHAIGGSNANSRFGPDLTHFASRSTIAAGVLENNRGNLGGWLLNPQTIKPGNKMPPVLLESADFQALLAYLESLE